MRWGPPEMADLQASYSVCWFSESPGSAGSVPRRCMLGPQSTPDTASCDATFLSVLSGTRRQTGHTSVKGMVSLPLSVIGLWTKCLLGPQGKELGHHYRSTGDTWTPDMAGMARGWPS